MFARTLSEIGDGFFKSLLEKLEECGFVVESVDESILSDDNLAEAWDHYYDDPNLAVSYLETMFGFIFERKAQNESSTIGLKDWNKLVIAAKELIKEYGVEEASEHLAKTFSFLNMFEIEKLIDQAVE